MKERFKTVESYFIGQHQFKIQMRSVHAAPGLPDRYTRDEYRVYHRWLGRKGNKALAHFIAEDMETEGGCRERILSYLQTWRHLGSTKMFKAKGKSK
jgi:hypothetical protein